MNKSYTIIQCSNYFEYMNFKDKLQSIRITCKLFDSTYTVRLPGINHSLAFMDILNTYAPTAIITQVSFRNGRAIYTKLKD